MGDVPRDLVDRTFEFAQHVRAFVNDVPRAPSNVDDIRQVVRSSGSVAANDLESQEGLSRRAFFYRIKICRKESRESALWLRLIDLRGDSRLDSARDSLVSEAEQLKRIFASIAAKDDTK